MEIKEYFHFNKTLRLKSEENLTSDSLYKKLKRTRSNKLRYTYEIIDELKCQLRPRIVWGNFHHLHLIAKIQNNSIHVTSKINSSIKLILGACVLMLLAFVFQ